MVAPRIPPPLSTLTSLLLLTAWPAAAAPSGTRDAERKRAHEPRRAAEWLSERLAPQARPPAAPDAPLGAQAVDNQLRPAAIADGSGGMIVVWEEVVGPVVSDIHLKAFDANGAARWPTVVVCAATGNQSDPTIVSDGAGGAIVTWYDLRAARTPTSTPSACWPRVPLTPPGPPTALPCAPPRATGAIPRS